MSLLSRRARAPANFFAGSRRKERQALPLATRGVVALVGARMEPDARTQVLKMCREILAPLVRADGGVMYLVSVSSEEVHIHLAGTCAGCPGASLTRDRVLEPALLSVAPKASVKVTTGWIVPNGAEKVG
jgi:Fe-S cluster biogenesis protein NfuA